MPRWPAEFAAHDAMWIGFPGDPAEWPVGLAQAQEEIAALANAVADEGRGERVRLVCRTDADRRVADRLTGSGVLTVVKPFGDIWLRDSGPVVTVAQGARVAQSFRFNGWGGKFNMAGDGDIGGRLAAREGLKVTPRDWVCEGGAIDGNGKGTILTTRQCLLNPNRNGTITPATVEQRLGEALGVTDICWLDDGLAGDHTDGHVDNLARFVSADTVAVPVADQADDPNAAVFDRAAERVAAHGLKVAAIPSVGRFELDGAVAPASYANFLIADRVVAVPQYGAAKDAAAVRAIGALFPNRTAIGLPSGALLRGGGSFHCASQQLPAI